MQISIRFAIPRFSRDTTELRDRRRRKFHRPTGTGPTGPASGHAAATMTALETYRRTVALLAPERGLAIALAVAGVALAVVQLAEPILFGRMVDALAQGPAAPSA